MTLEVEPIVGGDATTIDLNLVPQVVEFEGFINYGSPILRGESKSHQRNNRSSPVLLTQNVINQPVFSTRKGHDECERLRWANGGARRVDA